MKYQSLHGNISSTKSYSPHKDWINNNYKRKNISKRKRKTVNQLKVLTKEFKISTIWNKEQISKISEITGLNEAQIYKWSWDQKNKNLPYEKMKIKKVVHLSEIFYKLPTVSNIFSSKNGLQIDTSRLECNEIISPSHADFDIYHIQNKYRYCLESLSGINELPNKCLDSFFEESS